MVRGRQVPFGRRIDPGLCRIAAGQSELATVFDTNSALLAHASGIAGTAKEPAACNGVPVLGFRTSSLGRGHGCCGHRFARRLRRLPLGRNCLQIPLRLIGPAGRCTRQVSVDSVLHAEKLSEIVVRIFDDLAQAASLKWRFQSCRLKEPGIFFAAAEGAEFGVGIHRRIRLCA